MFCLVWKVLFYFEQVTFILYASIKLREKERKRKDSERARKERKRDNVLVNSELCTCSYYFVNSH